MKFALLFMLVLIVVVTGCTNKYTSTGKQQETTVGKVNPANEQKTESNTPNDFSLSIGDTYITLHDREDNINLEVILGVPVTQTIEKLENADTYTGSLIKKLSFDGLHIELFSPKQEGEAFWVMSMHVFKKGYRTPEGIEVGSTLEEVKTAYPDIEMTLDGRTDPENGAYEIHDEMQLNFLQFEVKGGLVSEIKFYSLLP